MIDFTPLLTDVTALTVNNSQRLNTFLDDSQLLINGYINYRNRPVDNSINIFTLISDQYYKENMHSDVLKMILCPDGDHGEGDRFLRLFFDYLNISYYQQPIVEREVGRRDITIKDEGTKHAIIIENKMNNAMDMHQQIPRYVESLMKQGYIIDAVIYLILVGNKQPDSSGWTQQQRDEVLPKIRTVLSYSDYDNMDLYNGWLLPCKTSAKDEEVRFSLHQYAKLIKKLGANNMNKLLMKDFLDKMLTGNNYETANALSDMLKDLLIYRRDKLIEHFRPIAAPFTNVTDYYNAAVIEGWFFEGGNYAMDIYVEKDQYHMFFFDRVFVRKIPVDGETNTAIHLLKDSPYAGVFKINERHTDVSFRFPEQEAELYTFVEEFILYLNTLQTTAATLYLTSTPQPDMVGQ